MTHILCHYTLHFPPMQNLKVTQARKGEKTFSICHYFFICVSFHYIQQ